MNPRPIIALLLACAALTGRPAWAQTAACVALPGAPAGMGAGSDGDSRPRPLLQDDTVVIDADQASYERRLERYHLQGNVELRRAGELLRAE